jgi:MinD-like ATPase involved in chromosome partitioning or flagellar assembly
MFETSLGKSTYKESVGESPMIIALHSFKGGTGKSILALNLASMFAKMGKKTCLVELDFSAPSFFATFKNDHKRWMNDYLNKTCKIETVLTDCSTENMGEGKLFVGLADPSTEAIRDMASKDRKWEIEALGRLLSLRDYLTKEMRFDYVFFDTSPGLQYSSINAIVASDVVLIVSSTDKSDVEGTRRMIQDFYEVFQKKTALIVNKVPFERVDSDKFGEHQSRLLGRIPCSCDVARVRIEGLFAPENPDHEFNKKLKEVAEGIELMRCSTSCSLSPSKKNKVENSSSITIMS